MKTSTQTLRLANTFGAEEAVRIISEAGFDCADHSLFGGVPGKMHIENDSFFKDMEKLRKIAASYGLEFNQTHAPFTSFKEGDDEYNNWMKPLIIRAIEATAVLGARYVVIHPFYVSKDKKEANMDYFGSLVPYAKKNGVMIAIENMFGYDPEADKLIKNVCSDAGELSDYIDSLDSRNVCACIDVGHCGLVGEDPAEMIRETGKRVMSLHVHDNDNISDLHTIPFAEKIDFTSIAGALRDIDYKGEMTLEADRFMFGFPKELYPECLRIMGKAARYLADL